MTNTKPPMLQVSQTKSARGGRQFGESLNTTHNTERLRAVSIPVINTVVSSEIQMISNKSKSRGLINPHNFKIFNICDRNKGDNKTVTPLPSPRSASRKSIIWSQFFWGEPEKV